MAKLGLQSVGKPSPRWFRITKKLVNNLTNFAIALLMIVGHRADDITLLIIKLAQSFVMDTLDTLMSNGEVYAVADTESIEVKATVTSVDATKQ